MGPRGCELFLTFKNLVRSWNDFPTKGISFKDKTHISYLVKGKIIHGSSEDVRSKARKYRCEICGIVFKDTYALAYHKSVQHSADKKSPSGVG
jgi:hypothetical protein